jgi:predicted ferric reductase
MLLCMSVMTRTRPPLRRTATDPVQLRRPVVRRWWRDAAGLLAWASLLVVVALWLAHGGIQGLSGADGWLTGTGRLAGLLAADLMLLQVLLMARVPFVERSYGQDELARRHRLVGFASFNLMLAHVVLITVGYALTDRRDVVREAWHLVWTYPGMLLATAGFAALCMVVVTSVRAARRRLRYESWHLLHLYAYLGAGLALPHQIWTGADFVATPWARAYWWTLWAGSLGAVLVYRVGLPIYRSLRHRLVVSDVSVEAPGVVSVSVTGRDLHRLPVRAGQFLQWRFLDGPGWTRAHPYSLSAAPTADRLRLTVKDLGDDSRRLSALRPGTRVLVEGPYGRLTAEVRTRRRVTLLASGIGITPLRALLEDLPAEPGDVTLVYRTSGTGDALFTDELDELVRTRGVRVLHAPGRRVAGRRSWLPQQAAHLSDAQGLLHLVPDVAEHDVYLCGSAGWMDAARQAALDAGVPAERVHLERFSW